MCIFKWLKRKITVALWKEWIGTGVPTYKPEDHTQSKWPTIPQTDLANSWQSAYVDRVQKGSRDVQ